MFQVQARDVDHAVSIVHRAYFGKRPEKTYASTVVHALEDVPQLFDIEMT